MNLLPFQAQLFIFKLEVTGPRKPENWILYYRIFSRGIKLIKSKQLPVL